GGRNPGPEGPQSGSGFSRGRRLRQAHGAARLCGAGRDAARGNRGAGRGGAGGAVRRRGDESREEGRWRDEERDEEEAAARNPSGRRRPARDLRDQPTAQTDPTNRHVEAGEGPGCDGRVRQQVGPTWPQARAGRTGRAQGEVPRREKNRRCGGKLENQDRRLLPAGGERVRAEGPEVAGRPEGTLDEPPESILRERVGRRDHHGPARRLRSQTPERQKEGEQGPRKSGTRDHPARTDARAADQPATGFGDPEVPAAEGERAQAGL